MTIGADLRREKTKWRVVQGPLDGVDTVAVNASRHIRIAFPDQRCAVYALPIEIVDLGMTALTCVRNAGWLLTERSSVMRAVAIGTDRSITVSCGQRGLM